jgi:phosphatidylserine/phosphatidylglycerophosphate/cardiolipin synthase-like enzyme
MHGDNFFQHLFTMIDSAESHVFIITYAMDSSPLSKLILRKLTEAKKRGVRTVLLVDDLMQHCDSKAIQDFSNAGGIFRSLNPQWRPFTPWDIFRKIFVNM